MEGTKDKVEAVSDDADQFAGGQRQMTQRDLVQLMGVEARSFFKGRKIEYHARIDVVRELGRHLRDRFSDVVLLDPPEEPLIEKGEPVSHTETCIRFMVHLAMIEVGDLFDEKPTT